MNCNAAGGIIGDGTFTIGSGAKLVIDEDATGFGVEMDWYLVNNGKLMLKVVISTSLEAVRVREL